MTFALLIEAAAREIVEVELPELDLDRLATLQKLVGGYLEAAYMWPTGDVLYVDEDGDRHAWRSGFHFLPRSTGDGIKYLGSGVVVGREVSGTEDWAHLSPVITADELAKLVRFFRRTLPGDVTRLPHHGR